MFERSCRRFRDNRRQAGRASLGHEDAVRSSRFRGPDDRTEILRIFDSVQDDKERRFTLLASRFQNVGRAAVGFGGDEGDDALVIAAGNEAVESRGRLDMDGDLSGLCLLNDLCELPVSTLNEQAL